MFGLLGSIEVFAIIMFFIALFGTMASNDIIKAIIFLVLMQSSVIVFWISFGYHDEILPPIGEYLAYGIGLADPLPQALMITAIVIGMAVTAVALTMLITLCRKYQSTMWHDIKERSDKDTAL